MKIHTQRSNSSVSEQVSPCGSFRIQTFTSSNLLKNSRCFLQTSKKPEVSHQLTYDLSLPRLVTGGGRRDRTDDPLLAKQVLSQLSYAPVFWWAWLDLNQRPHAYQACALTN
jgi:hypothetical protein